jgi:phage repressor protein C with HTH and peptisase S24 domain
MNWDIVIENLKRDGEISIRPSGNSMTPRIKSKDLVTLTNDISDINKNDIVLCKVKGSYYIHLVTAIKGDQYQISNNHGHVNGWITKNAIFGKVIKIG